MTIQYRAMVARVSITYYTMTIDCSILVPIYTKRNNCEVSEFNKNKNKNKKQKQKLPASFIYDMYSHAVIIIPRMYFLTLKTLDVNPIHLCF